MNERVGGGRGEGDEDSWQFKVFLRCDFNKNSFLDQETLRSK